MSQPNILQGSLPKLQRGRGFNPADVYWCMLVYVYLLGMIHLLAINGIFLGLTNHWFMHIKKNHYIIYQYLYSIYLGKL